MTAALHRSARPIRLAAGGMMGMAAAMGIGRFVYTPILPSMIEGAGLSSADAGLIASANYIGYLIGAVLASGGWAASRERGVALAGLAASAALAGAMASAGGLNGFMVIRFLAGLASAFGFVFLTNIVFSGLAEAGRSDLQKVHFSGVGIGISLSSLMLILLHGQGFPWQASWIGAGILSVVGLAGAWLLLERGPPAAGIAAREPPVPVSTALVRTILAYALFGVGYVVTVTFLVAIVRSGGHGPLAEPVVWLVAGLAALASMWAWEGVIRRIGVARAYSTACAVEAAGIAASVAIPGLAGPLIGGFLTGGTFVVITALGLQAGRRLAGEAPRRVLAWMTAIFGIGQIIGPVVAGYIADWTGDFFIASLAAAASLAFSAILMPRDPRAA